MLIFQNPGIIPEDAITTMGVHAKINDNPIGQFGTGAKYAIAIVLRNGGKFTIWKGKKKLEFGLLDSKIRGKDFRIVTMNGRKLGFTDHLGMNWKPWMAYRELYSNCRDEGGSIRQIVPTGDSEDEVGQAKITKIIVEWPEMEQIHTNRHQIILPTEPMFKLNELEVHPDVDSSHLYYKGIRVMDLSLKAKFTYSLTGNHLLTEDRTLMYPSLVPSYLVKAFIQCSNRDFLRAVLNTDIVSECYEGKLNYELARDTKPSLEFLEVAEQLMASKRLVAGAGSLFKHYQDTLPGYVSPYIVAEFSETERAMIDGAIEVVHRVFPDFDRTRMSFKTQQQYRVQNTKDGMILNAKLIERGRMHIARAIVEGIATSNKGGVAEQLTNYILTKAWIPEELVDQYSKSGDNYDLLF